MKAVRCSPCHGRKKKGLVVAVFGTRFISTISRASVVVGRITAPFSPLLAGVRFRGGGSLYVIRWYQANELAWFLLV